MSDSKLLYPTFLARVLAWETKSSGWWGLGQQESVPLFPPPYWHEIWLSLDQFLLNLPSAISFQFFSTRVPSPNSDLGPANGPRKHAMPNSESCDHSKAAAHCHANNSKVHLDKKCQSPFSRHSKLSKCFCWSLLSHLVLWMRQGPCGYGLVWLNVSIPLSILFCRLELG